MKKMKILGMCLESGSALYRMWQIARHFRDMGHEFLNASYSVGFPEEVAKLSDIVVVQATYDKKLVDKIKKLKKKLVYEVDDLYSATRRDDSQGKEIDEQREKRIAATEYCIKKADLVTVTTKRLKEKISHLNDNIVVLPNYLDIRTWPKPRKNNSRTLRIGWAGSISHKADLKQILNPVIKEVIKKHPEVRFVYCGFGGMSSEDKITQIEFGEDIFEGIPRKNREFMSGTPVTFWPLKASALEFDIALAPLIDDEFNKSKSNLKYLEYGLLGYPGVYSPTIYKEAVKHGETGFIAETKEDWIKYIDLLIKDAKLRNTIRDNAREDILKNYDIKDHIGEWEKVYSSICPEEDRESGETNSKGKSTKAS